MGLLGSTGQQAFLLLLVVFATAHLSPTDCSPNRYPFFFSSHAGADSAAFVSSARTEPAEQCVVFKGLVMKVFRRMANAPGQPRYSLY
jgi:hypothetical protein